MNRIHTGLTAFTATVVASLLLTGCSSGTDTGGADAGGTLESFDPTVIRAALITPQAGTNGVVADSLFEYVTEATAGKITFEPTGRTPLSPLTRYCLGASRHRGIRGLLDQPQP